MSVLIISGQLESVYATLRDTPESCLNLTKRVSFCALSVFEKMIQDACEIVSFLKRVISLVSDVTSILVAFLFNEVLGRALAWSAIKSYTGIQNFLESRGISKGTRGVAVKIATREGCESSVRKLLEGGEILDEYLGEALGWSIVYRHEAIERYLESRGISKDARGRAVRVAAGQGCESGVRKLLEDGEISDWDLGCALETSIIKGHKEVERYLKSKGVKKNSV